MARKLSQRLAELHAAPNLAVIRQLPGAHCHELHGNRQGELALSVSPNYRLIIEPAQVPLPRTSDGGLDWAAVTRIQINGIEDYH